VGNFNSTTLRVALFLLVSLGVGMVVREYARAYIVTRLNDPTPRLWGRLSLNPRTWFDPFGSALLPGLILLLWAAGASFLPPPVAYAKPAPIDPSYFRRFTRDSIVAGLAGPLANVVLALIAGLAVRAGVTGELLRFVVAFEFTNLCLAFFHLLPIPGLDGARLLGLALPPRAREVYRNADQYLALIVLVVLFLFAGPLLDIIYSLTNAFCDLFGGSRCTALL
jgi:Zn-dependent protease